MFFNLSSAKSCKSELASSSLTRRPRDGPGHRNAGRVSHVSLRCTLDASPKPPARSITVLRLAGAVIVDGLISPLPPPDVPQGLETALRLWSVQGNLSKLFPAPACNFLGEGRCGIWHAQVHLNTLHRRFFFPMPFITFALFFSPSYNRRNTDPGSHSRLFSPLPAAVRAF